MNQFSFDSPAFLAYTIASAVMVLKASAMSWLTVARMLWFGVGLRSPEDLKRTLLNRNPDPKQLLPDERIERIRRIHHNDLENLPFFFVAGALYLVTAPPVALAQWLFYGYAVSRLLHFAAYLTGQIHDIRASLWTIGSLIVIFMSLETLWDAFSRL
jgi:glutathione S-transferase